MKTINSKHIKRIDPRYRLGKDIAYVGCDDGTTYVFRRSDGSPRYECIERIKPSGERVSNPHILPRMVENWQTIPIFE